MASVNDVMGQIGAAKLFAGNISNTINAQGKRDEENEKFIEGQIEQTTDEAQKKRLQKKLKRIKSTNKLKSLNGKVANGATDLLTTIASYCDIGKEEIIKWVAYFLVTILPALEIAVKAILLTNIKKMISCALDPRIPDKWRTEGVLVNEQEIDPRGILETSPYSKVGKYNYFNVQTGDDNTIGLPTYSLVRASDMNAFIWFTKNCARFVTPNIMQPKGVKEFFADCGDSDNLYSKRHFKGKKEYKYLPGCAFKEKEYSKSIFLCTEAETKNNTTTYTILPVANTFTSVNWYKNKGNANKEKPLFSLEYSNDYNSTAPIPKNNFKFKILPRPFKMSVGFITDLESNISVLRDKTDQGIASVLGVEASTESKWSSMKWPGIKIIPPRAARFNGDGKYSKNGKYSISEENYFITPLPKVKHLAIFQLESNFKVGGPKRYLIYDSNKKSYLLSDECPTEGKLDVKQLSAQDASEVITECYCGNTVYQFNYDYIMSFQLFNAKVIAANIINTLLNIDCISVNLDFLKNALNSKSNTDQMYIDNYVDKLVEKIIDNEEHEFTDCFYNFSNKDYEALEKQTNERIINNTLESNRSNEVNEIYNMLDAYSTEASLEEQTEIIVKSFTRASEALDDSSGTTSSISEGNHNFESSLSANDFIKKIVKLLISQIVNAILTPKVLMLIQINKKLLGNDPTNFKDNYKYSVQDVLAGLEGTISSMIKEVIDTIHKELLRIVLSAIKQIMTGYIRQLSLEYARKWVDLLKQLLACFKLNKNKIDGTSSDSIEGILNRVDYADIDSLVDQVLPNTNPC